MTHFAVRAYAISLTIIFAVWLGVLFWGARELQRVLEMTP